MNTEKKDVFQCPKCESPNVAFSEIGTPQNEEDYDDNYGHCRNCDFGAPPNKIKKRLFLVEFKEKEDQTEAENQADQDAANKVINITVTLEHAKAAGMALKQFREASGMLDAYISMAYILAYMQESLGLDPKISFNNLAMAYSAILTDQKLFEEGFKVINEVLLEKKIIMPTKHWYEWFR